MHNSYKFKDIKSPAYGGENEKKKCIFQTDCRTKTNLGLKDIENQQNEENIQFVVCFSNKKNQF